MLMTTFLQFLSEANAAGSKFEQKVADGVSAWLKSVKLDKKFEAKRFQTIEEDDGARDEDFSDVVVTSLDDGSQFFIECKQNGDDNPVTNMFDIAEDYTVIPVQSRDREEVDDPMLLQLASDITSTDGFQKFRDFLSEETDWVRGGFNPADFYFSKQDIRDPDLQGLIKAYNQMIKDGEVESDNKMFDGKLIRESTRNMLAVALMWRLYDKANTWDICHVEDIDYFGDLIRKHYMQDKAASVKYMQLGDNLYVLDASDNPLRIVCQQFPEKVTGKFDLKFTPRFGTGSMYMTPRSKVTSELPPSCSFTDKARWPLLLK